MRRLRRFMPLIGVLVLGAPHTAAADDWTLASTTFADGVTTQPYVGNGYLGARIPAAGSGFVAAQGVQTWPTFAERFTTYPVDGVYAQEPSSFGDKEVLASVPAWSTITFGTGAETFSTSTPASQVSRYRQALDLRTGTVTTTGTWTALGGQAVDFATTVVADRQHEHRALVTLALKPLFTGAMTVTSTLDGSAARRTLPVDAGTDSGAHRSHVTVSTVAIGTTVAEDAVLVPGAGAVQATDAPVGSLATQSAGEQLTFPVVAGRTYEFAKYIAVVSSREAKDPAAVAASEASASAAAGVVAESRASAAAWAARWRASIFLPATPALQQVVRAAQFDLMASVRRDGSAIIGPSGLSSDSYAGAVFWDADTWMFPALLAQQPDLARRIEDFRFDTLGSAKANAKVVAKDGAFYSWTSGPDGSLDKDCYGTTVAAGMVVADANRSCTTEIHLQGDVALAQWQLYGATGDRAWLKARGWPVLQALAQYWASRAEPQANGRYALTGVQPPDEYQFQVSNEAYTNAVASYALRSATQAARIVGANAPTSWLRIAAGLEASIPFDAKAQMHPEYDGYGGAQVKQADVVMLTYPLGFPMPKQVAINDLDYYAQRTAPAGPAMTDAIHSIDASRLGVPGCSAWTYALRAYEPYLRAPFDQFSETRPPDTISAFDFLTGVGGFLQTFTYGFTGLQLRVDGVHVAPSLPPQLPALTLPGVQWHGRRLTIRETRARTVILLTRGVSLPLVTPRGRMRLRRGHPVVLPTRRPDRNRGGNLALCSGVTASSEVPGNPAIAAVDGSAATSWQAADPQATFILPLGKPRPVAVVRLRRGNASDFAYSVQTSLNGKTWTTAATGSAATADETLRFTTRRAAFVRLVFPGGQNAAPPAIAELEVRA
jgi:trehalose/maltose hydrolase-like predicted phosphorylase